MCSAQSIGLLKRVMLYMTGLQAFVSVSIALASRPNATGCKFTNIQIENMKTLQQCNDQDKNQGGMSQNFYEETWGILQYLPVRLQAIGLQVNSFGCSSMTGNTLISYFLLQTFAMDCLCSFESHVVHKSRTMFC